MQIPFATVADELPRLFLASGNNTPTPAADAPGLTSSIDRSAAIDAELRRQHTLLCARIDRQFAWLMLVQWAAAIATALWISPLAWAGDVSYPHPYLTMAIFYGGAVTLLPIVLTRIAPGRRITRLTIAVMQMLMSSLLIHLTGGRIETHFHIFGSLAFLAFYLDWQVLVVASVTIAIDHFLRGMFLPYSIFGTYVVQPWRWLEHTGWVVFSDIFFFIACADRLRNLRNLAARHIDHENLLLHAHFDSLTGLPNRSHLSEKIAEFIRNSSLSDSGFSCLYIDLDRFKEINDQIGHLSGDALLCAAAERIQSRLGSDAFLARLGGDEFVALVPVPVPQPSPQSQPQTDTQSVSPSRSPEEVACAILRSLLQPFNVHGKDVTLGASIGISRYPQDGQDEDELLLRSDRAMYNVKRAGRNDYLVHSPEMLAESNARDHAERNLHRALEEREFSLHYQPIFHASGAMAGLEALIRWSDLLRGNIPPSHFIPLAEETGLIVQLGNFVLHEACKQATDWHSRGLLPGRIAVNVSSLELAREDYAEIAIRTLRQHYTPPEAIELEVTETALVNDFALAERHLRELHEYGIRISIDDFGTGYSSLGRLRQLTLDTLKIDRIFIDGVASSEADRTVVEHIIAMAHTLGMKVVAEGVEDDRQLQALRSLGCDELQGFLLARPLDRETAEALLHHYSNPINATIQH
jgi:predicted signal transduction protein with EAL and GGDEF domain